MHSAVAAAAAVAPGTTGIDPERNEAACGKARPAFFVGETADKASGTADRAGGIAGSRRWNVGQEEVEWRTGRGGLEDRNGGAADRKRGNGRQERWN